MTAVQAASRIDSVLHLKLFKRQKYAILGVKGEMKVGQSMYSMQKSRKNVGK